METPKTPDMYAPHVFHGTSAHVTVPESSTAGLSTSGGSPALELVAEHAAGQHVGDILVARGRVQADQRADGQQDEIAHTAVVTPPIAAAARAAVV